MDSAKQNSPQALEEVGGGRWGGAGPVFAPDYSSFRSPLEEVNAIIATQVQALAREEGSNILTEEVMNSYQHRKMLQEDLAFLLGSVLLDGINILI